MNLFVSTEPYIFREMSDYFTFNVPSAKFHPQYKMVNWDGKIRLLNYKDSTIYVGLVSYIQAFCNERGYEFQNASESGDENFPLNEAVEFIKGQNLPSKFNPLTPERKYQVDAFVAAVRKRRMLLLSPTGSGKSLIIYLLIKLYLT